MTYSKPRIFLLSGLLAAALQASSVAAQEKNLTLFVGASAVKTVEDLMPGLNKSLKPEIVTNMDGNRVISSFCGIPHGDQKVLILSRKMSRSEMQKCEKDQGGFIGLQIASFILGLASNSPSLAFDASPKIIYLGLADEVPRSAVSKSNLSLSTRLKLLEETSDSFIHNPFRTWRDIDASLPDVEINFILPEAGTARLILDGRIMEAGCRGFKEVGKIFTAEMRIRTCTKLRKDGPITITKGVAFLDAKKVLLAAKKPTLALVPHLDLRSGGLTVLSMKGKSPLAADFDAVNFTIRRDTSIYVFEQAVFGKGPSQEASATAAYLTYFLSDRVIGPGGALVEAGFYALDQKERQDIQAIIPKMRGLGNMGVN